MQSADVRLKSFTQRTRSWPYLDETSANPAALADAGFYWKPSTSSPDNVVCFLCGKSLDGWADSDDPYDEHLSHSRRCGWAIVKSVQAVEDGELPFRWDDENELPKGERMSKARLETFGKWWPHENIKGWYGTSRRMAKAGFFYAPTDDSNDNVQCSYCYLGLDGWEAQDDPVHEHQRRKPSCPFFATRAAAPTKASAAKVTKSKRRETGTADPQPSNGQNLLLSPRSQRLHPSIADKQELRKGTVVSRMLKAPTPAQSPLLVNEHRSPHTMPSAMKETRAEMRLKARLKEDPSPSTTPRSVEFDLPEASTRTAVKPSSKGKAAADRASLPKALAGRSSDNNDIDAPRRRSMRIKVEEDAASIGTSLPLSVSSIETQGRPSSTSSTSISGRKRQQQQQDAMEASPAPSLSQESRASSISVVIPKKRKLTTAERALNSQNRDEASTEDMAGDPTQPEMSNHDRDEQSLVRTESSSSLSSKTSRKRKVGRIKDPEEIDEPLQDSIYQEQEDEGEESEQPMRTRRGRPKKSANIEDSQPYTAIKPRKKPGRPTKRPSRPAPLLKSPAKKSPKALIEIFELPDEQEQPEEAPEQPKDGQEQPTEELGNHEEEQEQVKENEGQAFTSLTMAMDFDVPPTTEEATSDLKKVEQTPGDEGGEPMGLEAATPLRLSDVHPETQDATPVATPPSSPHPEQNTAQTATPKRQQAVSMLDIETAQVVVVDPTTPARRPASRMDIEGWEDEDRRESTLSRLSSPFLSPSKWQLDSTSTPIAKCRTPSQALPTVTPRQRIRDMVGNVNFDTILSPMRSPASRKMFRPNAVSPAQKQLELIDRLQNLMEENDSSEVMAVAENALKEEVKSLRRSQNKERKIAAAIAVLEDPVEGSSEAQEDEDVSMLEPEAVAGENNTILGDNGNSDIMRTPVRKAGTSVLFDATTTPTTPINRTPINRTPMPISNVISAIGAASRRNHQVSASPFVRTPAKKTIDMLRLEDLEVRSVGSPERTEPEPSVAREDLPESKAENPFTVSSATQATPAKEEDMAATTSSGSEAPSSQRLQIQQQDHKEVVKNEQRPRPISHRLHKDPKENERRLRLMRECSLTERELKMTVEEFHRAILEEQVRQLELAGEAWIQRFQEESDRVRRALLNER